MSQILTFKLQIYTKWVKYHIYKTYLYQMDQISTSTKHIYNKWVKTQHLLNIYIYQMGQTTNIYKKWVNYQHLPNIYIPNGSKLNIYLTYIYEMGQTTNIYKKWSNINIYQTYIYQMGQNYKYILNESPLSAMVRFKSHPLDHDLNQRWILNQTNLIPIQTISGATNAGCR